MKHLKKYTLFKESTTDNFDKIIDILSSDCSEFLELLKQKNIKGIYRGAKIYDETIVDGLWEKIPHENRMSRDTYHKVSQIIDNGLEKKLGIPLRSKGVFASKDLSIAKDYGKFKNQAFLFFPVNGFRYFWNPNIDDLFTHLRDEYDWYDTAYPFETDPSLWSEEAWSDLNWIINGYKEGDIEQVKYQELTFICSKYYLLDLDYYDDFINYLFSK